MKERTLSMTWRDENKDKINDKDSGDGKKMIQKKEHQKNEKIKDKWKRIKR